ncbi:MAG: hypothetical protein V3574_05295 [Candidatus Moraniibacteriota bacterium]
MTEQASSKPWYKKLWVIALFVFFGFIIIELLSEGQNKENSNITRKQGIVLRILAKLSAMQPIMSAMA